LQEHKKLKNDYRFLNSLYITAATAPMIATTAPAAIAIHSHGTTCGAVGGAGGGCSDTVKLTLAEHLV
jgi:hypothetical protein